LQPDSQRTSKDALPAPVTSTYFFGPLDLSANRDRQRAQARHTSGEVSDVPVRFYENWTSKELLDRHLQSAHVQLFVAKAGQLLAEPPEITLWERLP
jgi:hypothetical protein